MPARRPTSLTPRSTKRIEVEGRAVGRAGKLQRRNPSRPPDVVDLVVALVEHAGGVHPPFQVLAAIDAGRPYVLAHRQGHLTPRTLQLLCDLGAAGRRAHHQHATVGDLSRIAVGLRRQHGDRRRHADGEIGQARDVARARRQHHGPAPPLAAVRAHEISRPLAANRGNGRVGSDRSRDRLGIVPEEVDHLRQRPVAVGVVALIAEARQPALPVRGEQPQRIPSLGAPRMGDLAALQQHMVDRTLREAAAHREPRVPCADDHGGDGTNRALSGESTARSAFQFTTTVTFVGLVTMS